MSATVTSLKASSSAYLNDETKVYLLTPAVAADLLKRLYDNQRPIIDRHVRALAELVDLGLWRQTSIVTIVRGLPSRDFIVVNGAHRLTMISRGTASVPISIRWIDVADADLVAEAEAEYRTHDVNGKSRSTKDILWSYENIRALGLDAHVVDKIAAAANFIELGFPATACGVDTKNRNADVRVQPLLTHVAAAKKFLGYIDSAKKKGLLYKEMTKKPFMAAAMAICGSAYASDQNLQTFFYTVSRDDGLAAADPRKLLVELMKNRWARTSGKVYSDVEKAVIVRKAWNAWINGDTPDYFRVDAETVLKAADFIRA